MLGIMVSSLFYFLKDIIFTKPQLQKAYKYTDLKLSEDTNQSGNKNNKNQILDNVKDLNSKLSDVEKIIDKL